MLQFTYTHTASNLILPILEIKVKQRYKKKARQSIKLNKFHFIPDNLLNEIYFICLFFFIFTATTVAMLLLLHTTFLYLSITNITSCKSWFNNSTER